MRTILLAAALALAPLATFAGPGPAFVAQTKADLFGYYMPEKDLKVGAFKLIDVALGAPDDFAKYLRGDRFEGRWAPVLLSFAPAKSKMQMGEGGPGWPGEFRVLPTAFTVTDRTVSFTGSDKRLGIVTFRGTIDRAALKAEQAIDAGSNGRVVMRGELTAGGNSYTGLSFTWFGGD